jgi:lipopolysaccharide/colanic/teichoic acid biosynthesis glycosyltransferase
MEKKNTLIRIFKDLRESKNVISNIIKKAFHLIISFIFTLLERLKYIITALWTKDVP